MDDREITHNLPQPGAEPDPDAIDAARTGDVPPATEGGAGESAPDDPSRAEIFALRPDLASEHATTDYSTPTIPEDPPSGSSPVAGETLMGTTDPDPGTPPPEEENPDAQP
jgi:hypothetical protein